MRLERGSPLRILDSKSPVDQQFFHECPIYTDHLTVEAQKVDRVLSKDLKTNMDSVIIKFCKA